MWFWKIGDQHHQALPGGASIFQLRLRKNHPGHHQALAGGSQFHNSKDHRFGSGCKDVSPGFILREPFPHGIEVDPDGLMQAPYCHADAGGPTRTTHKL